MVSSTVYTVYTVYINSVSLIMQHVVCSMQEPTALMTVISMVLLADHTWAYRLVNARDMLTLLHTKL